MTWLEVLREFGLSVVVTLILLGFGVKFLWPFIQGQVAAAQSERLLEHQAFLAALKELQIERANERKLYMDDVRNVRDIREKERTDFLAMLQRRDEVFAVELRRMANSLDEMRREIRRWRVKPNGDDGNGS